MSTVETLRAAKALIAEPESWMQGGNHALLNGRNCYCVIGAVKEAGDPGSAYQSLVGQLGPAGWIASVARFNDDPATTHADVLALFDRAIAAEEAKGATS